MLEESAVTAGELMTRDVAVVHPEDSLVQAVKLMAHRQISGLVVVDAAGTIVGVLTEGDLMRWHQGRSEKQAQWLERLAEGGNLAPSFLGSLRDEHNKVKAVMSSAVITASEDTPGREIANLMVSKGIKRIPVLRDGRLVGIVARSDLVRALAEKLGERPHAGEEETTLARSVNEALKRRREETVPQRRG